MGQITKTLQALRSQFFAVPEAPAQNATAVEENAPISHDTAPLNTANEAAELVVHQELETGAAVPSDAAKRAFLAKKKTFTAYLKDKLSICVTQFTNFARRGGIGFPGVKAEVYCVVVYPDGTRSRFASGAFQTELFNKARANLEESIDVHVLTQKLLHNPARCSQPAVAEDPLLLRQQNLLDSVLARRMATIDSLEYRLGARGIEPTDVEARAKKAAEIMQFHENICIAGCRDCLEVMELIGWPTTAISGVVKPVVPYLHPTALSETELGHVEAAFAAFQIAGVVEGGQGAAEALPAVPASDAAAAMAVAAPAVVPSLYPVSNTDLEAGPSAPPPASSQLHGPFADMLGKLVSQSTEGALVKKAFRDVQKEHARVASAAVASRPVTAAALMAEEQQQQQQQVDGQIKFGATRGRKPTKSHGAPAVPKEARRVGRPSKAETEARRAEAAAEAHRARQVGGASVEAHVTDEVVRITKSGRAAVRSYADLSGASPKRLKKIA